MSVAEQIPGAERKIPRHRPPKRNGRWAGYLHLLGARMLELKREPEVVFWVFVFPLLLATGLGIAFRNKPADAARVAVVSSEDARHVISLLQSSAAHTAIRADIVDLATAKNGLRLGKYDLIIEPPHEGHIIYDFDPGRPESVV
jgi:hypothetical protein